MNEYSVAMSQSCRGTHKKTKGATYAPRNDIHIIQIFMNAFTEINPTEIVSLSFTLYNFFDQTIGHRHRFGIEEKYL